MIKFCPGVRRGYPLRPALAVHPIRLERPRITGVQVGPGRPQQRRVVERAARRGALDRVRVVGPVEVGRPDHHSPPSRCATGKPTTGPVGGPLSADPARLPAPPRVALRTRRRAAGTRHAPREVVGAGRPGRLVRGTGRQRLGPLVRGERAYAVPGPGTRRGSAPRCGSPARTPDSGSSCPPAAPRPGWPPPSARAAGSTSGPARTGPANRPRNAAGNRSPSVRCSDRCPTTWPAFTHSASMPNMFATSTRDSRRASSSCVSVGFQASGFTSTSAFVTIGERMRCVSIAFAFSSDWPGLRRNPGQTT